jgi:hypothetical protein
MDPSVVPNTGFLGRRHFKIRFSDVSEFFLSRCLLLKAPDPHSDAEIEIEFSLLDLFPKFQNETALADHLSGKFLELSERITELMSDVVNAVSGFQIEPKVRQEPAVEFLNGHLERRLHFLAHGDDTFQKQCIEQFSRDTSGPLYRFRVRFVPKKLAAVSSENLRDFLDIARTMLRKIAQQTDKAFLRIDYRKQLDTLVNFLDRRREHTGETEFSFETKDVGFRHAVLATDDMLTLPSPGTTGASERILLPLFLEINGDLDILSIGLSSDPLDVNDVTIRHTIARPSIANAFGVTAQGLTPDLRRGLNEHELKVYDRVYRRLAKRFIFAGKPSLESSFGELFCWLIRKVSYCLEEPSFLKQPAVAWLAEHRNDKYRKFEDDFFLPVIYERLREHFGTRVMKKPEQFRGEVDVLFDTSIPIELKARESGGSAEDAVNAKYPGEGQAAAYAANSRLGIVLLLDVVEEGKKITNLEHCVAVTEREFDGGQNLPTCIVVLIFHCHHPRPSSVA